MWLLWQPNLSMLKSNNILVYYWNMSVTESKTTEIFMFHLVTLKPALCLGALYLYFPHTLGNSALAFSFKSI